MIENVSRTYCFMNLSDVRKCVFEFRLVIVWKFIGHIFFVWVVLDLFFSIIHKKGEVCETKKGITYICKSWWHSSIFQSFVGYDMDIEEWYYIVETIKEKMAFGSGLFFQTF